MYRRKTTEEEEVLTFIEKHEVFDDGGTLVGHIEFIDGSQNHYFTVRDGMVFSEKDLRELVIKLEILNDNI